MAEDDTTDTLARLLENTAAGDRRDFEALYQASARDVFATIYRVTQDRAEAEEVLQETFVKIWRHAPSYDSTKGRALPWMRTIARREAINHLKSAQMRRRSTSEPLNESQVLERESAEEAVTRRQDVEILVQCITNLRPRYRQLVEMAYVNGLTYQEISQQLGVPVNTLKTWMRRAIEEMRTEAGAEL